MRRQIVSAANVSWRTIAGVDFQVIGPYVMVAKPDPFRSTWVWLRKDGGVSASWEVFVTPAGAPAKSPVAIDQSASGALAVAMLLPVWDTEVNFKPVAPMPEEKWEYPEERSYRRRFGDYPDRTTAYDSRWDHVNSGVGPYT